MKKHILPLLAALALALPIHAQTLTNLPTFLDGPGGKVWDFLTASSNIMIAPYGIISTDGKKFGGGIGAGFRVSEFVVPTLRLDYYDGRVWMPSASLQLQLPVTLAGKLTAIPFAFGGLATPLSGKGNDNGSAVGIVGVGLAVRIGTHWDIIGDLERWTGFAKDQVRLGVVYKF